MADAEKGKSETVEVVGFICKEGRKVKVFGNCTAEGRATRPWA